MALSNIRSLVKGDLNVTGSISGSIETTASFARIEAIKIVGDGSGITGITSTAEPGGSTTQVQFNNAGSMGGSSKFVFDSSTGKVTLTGTGISGSIESTGSFGVVEATTFRGDGSQLTGVTVDTSTFNRSIIQAFEFVSGSSTQIQPNDPTGKFMIDPGFEPDENDDLTPRKGGALWQVNWGEYLD